MKRLIAAAAVATALSTSGLWAQAEPTMDESLSMLELAAKRELTAIGLTDVDPMALSLNQLAQIKSVFESSDYTVNEQERQVRAIIAE